MKLNLLLSFAMCHILIFMHLDFQFFSVREAVYKDSFIPIYRQSKQTSTKKPHDYNKIQYIGIYI